MSSAFDLHSAYMSQAWRTLRDSIILKLDKLERYYPPNHAGTPSGAHKWHMHCPNHKWANVDNGHVWQHANGSWHCQFCEKHRGKSEMRGKPWFVPKDKTEYGNNGKSYNTTDRYLEESQWKLDTYRRQMEYEERNQPPQPTDLGWGVQNNYAQGTEDQQTRFKVN